MTPQDADAAFSALVSAETGLTGLEVFTGTSPDVLPQEALAIVACGPLKKVAGKFYTGEVSFVIDSPALADSLSAHNALCAALQGLLSDSAGLVSGFDSDAANLIGTHLDRTDQRTQDARWIFEASLVCGFTEI